MQELAVRRTEIQNNTKPFIGTSNLWLDDLRSDLEIVRGLRENIRYKVAISP